MPLNGDECDLKERTKKFALRSIRLYSSLDKSAVSHVLGRQMLRSGMSLERIIAKRVAIAPWLSF